MKNVLEWVKQHKKAAIGAGIGAVALIAAVIVVVLGVTGVIPASNIFGGGDITRGEWIKMFGEKFNMANYDSSEPYYLDVKSDNEAFAYVQTLVENEIMSGEGEAKLDEKITLEEAYIQLAKNYGSNYVKGVLGKEELTDKDWVTFLTEKAEVSTERMNKGFSREVAEELLDKVWDHYLNREFRNISEIDYAENVIDLSAITNYEYVGNKLTVSTAEEITEGKVLVLGESEEYIAGLAVKVVKVSKSNNKYELEVTTPELEEVVDRFYMETSQLIDFEGFEPADGVSIVEVGEETANTEYKSAVANLDNVIYAEQSELLLAKFNADKKGKFLKLNLNLTEGKVSTTAIWEELGYELDVQKAEGFQYTLDDYGKVVSKYDDSGYEVKGGLTLKDLILNGEVNFEWGKLTFDFNAGITAQPSLSLVGNIKGKQIKVGSKEIKLCLGCSARIDIYVYVDFEGKISVEPEFVGLVNVKKKAGKSVNTTGKCESNFKSEINCELKVKAGPDVVVNVWGVGDVLDVYAYMGVGADVTYSTSDPLKIVADVYAPTLEAGVSDADNTVLRKMGIKLKVKLIDKEGALMKCPFTARYTYDILSKDWNSQPGIPDETQSSTEESTGALAELTGSEVTGEEPSGKDDNKDNYSTEISVQGSTENYESTDIESSNKEETIDLKRIPVGCSYYIASTGETLNAGEKFPEKVEVGDTYTTTEYKYSYWSYTDIFCYDVVADSVLGRKDGWNVRAVDTAKSNYGEILSSVAGEPVRFMIYTFYGCENMIKAPQVPSSVVYMFETFVFCKKLVVAPEIPNGVKGMFDTFAECGNLKIASAIPDSVVLMHCTFMYCTSLTGEIIVNANPVVYSGCFFGVDFDKQNITLAGSSTKLDKLKSTYNTIIND